MERVFASATRTIKSVIADPKMVIMNIAKYGFILPFIFS